MTHVISWKHHRGRFMERKSTEWTFTASVCLFSQCREQQAGRNSFHSNLSDFLYSYHMCFPWLENRSFIFQDQVFHDPWEVMHKLCWVFFNRDKCFHIWKSWKLKKNCKKLTQVNYSPLPSNIQDIDIHSLTPSTDCRCLWFPKNWVAPLGGRSHGVRAGSKKHQHLISLFSLFVCLRGGLGARCLTTLANEVDCMMNERSTVA